ncbi:MAG: hypothetical protein QOK43_1469 [Acidimicrobiaceae bacterium]|nr:hypothetical protein [Acidimicrobiaceae bacterium]
MTNATLSPAHHEAALRRLEMRITRRLDGLLHGDHQGLVLAAGSELGEAREYRVGDDVRRMDWNLTARTTVPHVRDTVAERELESWLVVDRTASMDFGTARNEKRETAIGAAAAFAFLNNRAGNRTGAVLVDRADRPTVLPARSGRDQVLGLLHTLITREGGPGQLEGALVTTDRLARRRGLVVVVSDFLDPSEWRISLRRLAGRHQVVAVEVRDPREDDLPAVGLLTLVDPETGRRVEVQTDSAKLRRRFAAAAADKRSATAKDIRSAGARHVVLSTDRDWFIDLVRAVDRWRRRR